MEAKQIQENVNNVIINVNLNEEDNNVILQIVRATIILESA